MYAKVSNLSLIGELDDSLKESESGLPSLIHFLFNYRYVEIYYLSSFPWMSTMSTRLPRALHILLKISRPTEYFPFSIFQMFV